jgi:hypothetical protein
LDPKSELLFSDEISFLSLNDFSLFSSIFYLLYYFDLSFLFAYETLEDFDWLSLLAESLLED